MWDLMMVYLIFLRTGNIVNPIDQAKRRSPRIYEWELWYGFVSRSRSLDQAYLTFDCNTFYEEANKGS